jgi:hypothetical protein
MIRLAFLSLFFLFCLPAQAGNYSAVIQDLPLMPNMTEVPDAAVSFDTAAGRVLETAATVRAGQRQVYSFYAAALPGLGWKRDGGSHMSYTRGKEALSIEVSVGDNPEIVRVHFRLGPYDATEQ